MFAAEKEIDNKPRYHYIICFLQSQEYTVGESGKDKKTLRRLAYNFFLSEDVLYKRNSDMVLLRCVDRHEADMLVQEVQEGPFDTHANGHSMAKKMLRVDYYWLEMESNCCQFVKKCHKC